MADNKRPPLPPKAYLGDAVYAQYDGWNVVLTTEDGISVSNQIVMEPEVLQRLDNYMEVIKAFHEEAGK